MVARFGCGIFLDGERGAYAGALHLWVPAYAGMTGGCAGERGDAFNALPPGASPAVASLPRPLRFAKGTVSFEPQITQIFADGL